MDNSRSFNQLNPDFKTAEPLPEEPIKVYRASDLIDLGEKTFDISVDESNNRHTIGKSPSPFLISSASKLM